MAKYKPEFITHIIEQKELYGRSYSEIADYMSDVLGYTQTSKDQVQKIYRKHQRSQSPKAPWIMEGQYTEPDRDLTGEESSQAASRSIRRIVVTADWHGFPNEDLLDAIIAEKPDGIIIAGDLFDSQYFADHPWNANQKLSEPSEEETNVRRSVKRLKDETVAWIQIIHGNHDIKIHKMVAKMNKLALNLIKDPIEEAVKGIPGVEIVRLKWDAHYPNGRATDMGQSQYMAMVGDALISHGNFSGKHPGDASRKLRDWLTNWRRYLGLGEIALTVQAHTHKMYHADLEGGWLVQVEPGIGGDADIQRYALDYDLKWSPAPLGAVVFDQEDTEGDGNFMTIRSSVRLIRPYR